MPRLNVKITTADGVCTAGLFRSTVPSASNRGVLLYMDAVGVRPALDGMAERLAQSGYIVLLPDLFYREGPYGPSDGATILVDEAIKRQALAMMDATTQVMTCRDGAFFLEALTQAGAAGPVGVVGYCMGGARALHAAAAYPDRISAAASFHGGDLASKAPDSPHQIVREIRARVYVGSAATDASFPIEQSTLLARALREAGVDHIIENYVGVEHGWAMPDLSVFDHAGAERHWNRLLTLFHETL